MSTRTNIVIQDEEGTKVILYHHCDGYIEGVGVDLIRYLIELITYSTYPVVINYQELLTLLPEEYEETKGIHGDIEYLYIIRFTDTSITMWIGKRKLFSYKYRTAKNFDSVKLYLAESELSGAVNLRDRADLGWKSDMGELENLVKQTMAPGVLKNMLAKLKYARKVKGGNK